MDDKRRWTNGWKIQATAVSILANALGGYALYDILRNPEYQGVSKFFAGMAGVVMLVAFIWSLGTIWDFWMNFKWFFDPTGAHANQVPTPVKVVITAACWIVALAMAFVLVSIWPGKSPDITVTLAELVGMYILWGVILVVSVRCTYALWKKEKEVVE